MVFPVVCVGCGRDNCLVCDDCLHAVPLRNDCEAAEPLVHEEYLDAIRIVSWYDAAVLKQLLHAAKYHGSKLAAQKLGIVLTQWSHVHNPYFMTDDAVLMPIPLHQRRLCERGYNQSALLAGELAAARQLCVDDQVLRRVRYTKQQVHLHKQERFANVAHAFSVTNNTVPEKVILIDDVVTTGATLDAAAQVLKQAGIEKVYALVLAKH